MSIKAHMSIKAQVAKVVIGAATSAATAYLVTKLPDLMDKLPGRSPIQRMTIDLTEEARQGRLQKVSGRDNLIQRLIAIICTNYGLGILTGKPGVGKTALVRHLACLAAEGSIPSLKGVRIVELSLVKVQGRGAASALKQLLQGGIDKFFDDLFTELRSLNRGKERTIVFIDEIHELFKKFPGAFDEKKQELADRGIFLLGATAEENAVERWLDGTEQAFERRQQTIQVPEMTAEETMEILRSISSGSVFDLVQVDASGICATVELSSKVFPHGVLPDRAIKLFTQVKTWCQNTLKSQMTEKEVAEYLAGGLVRQSSEQLLADLRRQQGQQSHERNFGRLYFPVCPASAGPGSYSPYVERAAEQLGLAFRGRIEIVELQPEPAEADALNRFLDEMLVEIDEPLRADQRRKEVVVLAGASKYVLRDVVGCFSQNYGSVVRCSLKTLCRARESERGIYPWAESFLRGLAESQESVVLHLEDADQLFAVLTQAKPKSRAEDRSMLRTFEQSSVGSTFNQLMRQTVGVSATDVVSSSLSESRAQPMEKDPLVDLFVKCIQERRIHIVISRTAPCDAFASVPLPGMTAKEVVDWLSLPMQGENDIQYERLLHFASQLKPGLPPEDYCYRLLQSTKNTQMQEGDFINAAFAMEKGRLPKDRIGEIWRRSGKLDDPIFIQVSGNGQQPVLSPELSRFLNGFCGQNPPAAWVEGPSDVQAEFTQVQVSAFLKSRQKHVAKIDLSGILDLQLEDLQQKAIIDRQFARFLETMGAIVPVVLIDERDFNHPYLKQKVLGLAQQKKIQLICFAKEKEAQVQARDTGVLASLGSVGTLVQQGANALGVGSLLSQVSAAVPSADAAPFSRELQEMQAVRFKDAPVSVDVLISHFLKMEMITHSFGDDPAVLSEGAVRTFNRAYRLLADKHGLQLEQIKAGIGRDLQHFSENGQLQNLTQTQIIDRITGEYRVQMNLSAHALKYAVNPQLTPCHYRIWRVFSSVVASAVQVISTPFKFVFGSMSSTVGYIASLSLLGLVRRLLGV